MDNCRFSQGKTDLKLHTLGTLERKWGATIRVSVASAPGADTQARETAWALCVLNSVVKAFSLSEEELNYCNIYKLISARGFTAGFWSRSPQIRGVSKPIMVCWGWAGRQNLGWFEFPVSPIHVTSALLNLCVWPSDVAFFWCTLMENTGSFLQKSGFEVTSVRDFCWRSCVGYFVWLNVLCNALRTILMSENSKGCFPLNFNYNFLKNEKKPDTVFPRTPLWYSSLENTYWCFLVFSEWTIPR